MLKPQGQSFPLPSLSPDLLQDRAVSISSQPVHLHLITSRENQLLLLIRNEHWLKSCEHIYAGFCDLLPWQMCFLLCFCNLHPRASRQFASTLYTLGQWLCSTWRGHKSHKHEKIPVTHWWWENEQFSAPTCSKTDQLAACFPSGHNQQYHTSVCAWNIIYLLYLNGLWRLKLKWKQFVINREWPAKIYSRQCILYIKIAFR